MNEKIRYVLFLSFLVVSISSCNFNSTDDPIREEFLIYSTIIDSVFDDSYATVFIEEDTRSLIRFIKKSTFSEELFDKAPEEYFNTLFDEKKSKIDKNLIPEYIAANRMNRTLKGKYTPDRNIVYLPYRIIYFYIFGKKPEKNPIFKFIKPGEKIGIISLSQIGFNRQMTKGLIEVSAYINRRTENFFLSLKKKDGKWYPQSNCYIYGPYLRK